MNTRTTLKLTSYPCLIVVHIADQQQERGMKYLPKRTVLEDATLTRSRQHKITSIFTFL